MAREWHKINVLYLELHQIFGNSGHLKKWLVCYCSSIQKMAFFYLESCTLRWNWSWSCNWDRSWNSTPLCAIKYESKGKKMVCESDRTINPRRNENFNRGLLKKLRTLLTKDKSNTLKLWLNLFFTLGKFFDFWVVNDKKSYTWLTTANYNSNIKTGISKYNNWFLWIQTWSHNP